MDINIGVKDKNVNNKLRQNQEWNQKNRIKKLMDKFNLLVVLKLYVCHYNRMRLRKGNNVSIVVNKLKNMCYGEDPIDDIIILK